MDGFSLIIGGFLGVLAGWAFSTATTKQREAHKRSDEFVKTKQKMLRMEGEAKDHRERRLSEIFQGFLLYTFGTIVIVILAAILFGSLA